MRVKRGAMTAFTFSVLIIGTVMLSVMAASAHARYQTSQKRYAHVRAFYANKSEAAELLY